MPAKKDYGDGHVRWTADGRFAPTKGGKSPGRGKPAAPPAKAAGGGSAPVRTPSPRQLSRASTEQLLDHFHQVSQQAPGTPGVDDALEALAAELGRREAPAEAERRVQALMDRGRSHLDAWAEVHGKDPAKLERAQRLAAVDAARRPGETRRKVIRRLWAEETVLQVMQAEKDTRGELLNRAGQAAKIDPISLWEGNPARATKYASDELKAWWAAHGGRTNLASFTAHLTGDREGIQRARLSGQGRDYGI